MRYEYRTSLVLSPDDGEVALPVRPIVFLRIHGPEGSERHAALVDSGADHCLLPRSIATRIGIEVQPCLGPTSEGISGRLSGEAFADVELELDNFVLAPISSTTLLRNRSFSSDFSVFWSTSPRRLTARNACLT
ncbi:MAG: retropepsin-like domain-containing protein [Planctomycetaceae bacterium]|nr:retropepsin-like domain-containing protein [Planctomycetaceae bacterium]